VFDVGSPLVVREGRDPYAFPANTMVELKPDMPAENLLLGFLRDFFRFVQLVSCKIIVSFLYKTKMNISAKGN